MNAEDTLAQHADTAYKAVRRINHLTVFGPALPAPDLYPVFGALTALGHGLEQAIGQLARGLQRSADSYDLYEADPDRTPAASIDKASGWLAIAAQHAGSLGYALSKAHTAIAGQGWTSHNEHDSQDRANQ